MEKWDLYDIDRNKLGKEINRGSVLGEGEYRMVVHVCIFNSDGDLLIQKRQPFKEGFSGMWDITVGGSSIAGENSREAATRELFEELGIEQDLTKQRPLFTINFENGFDDFYFLEKDVEIDALKLQYEEVEKVKWASKEEILRMKEDGLFIPYKPEMIHLVFSFRNGQFGTIEK